MHAPDEYITSYPLFGKVTFSTRFLILEEASMKCDASVLLAASVFHFRLLGIGQVKDYLRSRGLPVAGN